jgi:hypothetical protein
MFVIIQIYIIITTVHELITDNHKYWYCKTNIKNTYAIINKYRKIKVHFIHYNIEHCIV